MFSRNALIRLGSEFIVNLTEIRVWKLVRNLEVNGVRSLTNSRVTINRPIASTTLLSPRSALWRVREHIRRLFVGVCCVFETFMSSETLWDPLVTLPGSRTIT